MRTVLVMLACTAAILAVTAVPWILFGAWPPFAGAAIAAAVGWIAGGAAVYLDNH